VRGLVTLSLYEICRVVKGFRIEFPKVPQQVFEYDFISQMNVFELF